LITFSDMSREVEADADGKSIGRYTSLSARRATSRSREETTG
jgi:hypothetical protein